MQRFHLLSYSDDSKASHQEGYRNLPKRLKAIHFKVLQRRRLPRHRARGLRPRCVQRQSTPFTPGSSRAAPVIPAAAGLRTAFCRTKTVVCVGERRLRAIAMQAVPVMNEVPRRDSATDTSHLYHRDTDAARTPRHVVPPLVQFSTNSLHGAERCTFTNSRPAVIHYASFFFEAAAQRVTARTR